MCDGIWAILGGIIKLQMANNEVGICEGTDRTQQTLCLNIIKYYIKIHHSTI